MVISSPSGGGKTTICQGVMRKHEEYVFSVSLTTRKKRKGEREGIDYYFTRDEEFRQKVRQGKLVEWARVHNHYYGTLRRFVDLAQKDKVVLFDVDVKGGTSLKRKYPHSVLIFLLPPSLRELGRRLRRRKADDPEEVKRRIRTALKEIKFMSKYDYVVINCRIDESIKAVEEIINSEGRRISRLNLKETNKEIVFLRR